MLALARLHTVLIMCEHTPYVLVLYHAPRWSQPPRCRRAAQTGSAVTICACNGPSHSCSDHPPPEARKAPAMVSSATPTSRAVCESVSQVCPAMRSPPVRAVSILNFVIRTGVT
jgi:hypothetical protein